MVIEIFSLSDLRKFAEKTAASLRGGEILALSGNLGAGKTTFTKMLLAARGVRKKASSPTFVLMLPYKDRHGCTIYHMDLYRVRGYKEVAALGIEDLWGKKNSVFVIEWAEKISRRLPRKTIRLNFKVHGTDRKIYIKNASKEFSKNIGA